MSELDFAAEVLPQNIKVLAVTGTNGKSTVTSFAGQVTRSPYLLRGLGILPIDNFLQNLLTDCMFSFKENFEGLLFMIF